jgi:DNA polymerase IV
MPNQADSHDGGRQGPLHPGAPGEERRGVFPPDTTGPSLRKIVHIDMDAFYASIEQRDNPELRGKPVAVGSPNARGVVAAASYEARTFGVRSALPSVTAKRRCPSLIFVRPRFEVYKQVSLQIRAIFARYTALIEPLSLDEAYLDLTANLRGGPATDIAKEIKAAIRAETGLTASAGVSYNKFLAKLASDEKKPDGLFVITPKMGPGFIETLPVGKFHGVGPATAARMQRLGIHTGADLRERELHFLVKTFGKAGRFYYWIARGIDERPVRPDRARKSIGAETTLLEDLTDFEAMCRVLAGVAAKVWRHCEAAQVSGKTVTLKVKYADFQTVTRARSSSAAAGGEAELYAAGVDLLAGLGPGKAVRLLGLTVSNLDGGGGEGAPAQLSFGL